MHRIGSRTYVGEPGETVTVSTRVSDGAQASVFVNDADMGPNAQFQLPSDPGGRAQWQVQLSGPLGATCVVTIVRVDGSSDTDFLICQAHNPSPVHLYECAVAQASAMRALSRMRAAGPRTVPTRSRTAKAAAKKSAGRKGGAKKKTTSTRAAKKRGAARNSKKRARS